MEWERGPVGYPAHLKSYKKCVRQWGPRNLLDPFHLVLKKKKVPGDNNTNENNNRKHNHVPIPALHSLPSLLYVLAQRAWLLLLFLDTWE